MATMTYSLSHGVNSDLIIVLMTKHRELYYYAAVANCMWMSQLYIMTSENEDGS